MNPIATVTKSLAVSPQLERLLKEINNTKLPTEVSIKPVKSILADCIVVSAGKNFIHPAKSTAASGIMSSSNVCQLA
mgnify:CR=1 FL=1